MSTVCAPSTFAIAATWCVKAFVTPNYTCHTEERRRSRLVEACRELVEDPSMQRERHTIYIYFSIMKIHRNYSLFTMLQNYNLAYLSVFRRVRYGFRRDKTSIIILYINTYINKGANVKKTIGVTRIGITRSLYQFDSALNLIRMPPEKLTSEWCF